MPQAGSLATATSSYLADTADAVAGGRHRVRGRRGGLRTSAKEYDEADAAAGDVLGALRGVLGY